jgi:uncharacterized oxidoreductase
MRVDHHRLKALTEATFTRAGSAPGEAEIVAGHLVEANLVGHDSHGVLRTAKYLEWLKAGTVKANRHARVVHEGGAMICVEGEGGFGQVIAREAMELGIARALEAGLALIGIRDSGHLGRIGAWAEMAAEAGLVSVHFVNTSGFGILVAPFGGTDRRLSANPIAAGIPIPGRPPVILDIATSTIAEGKIQVARNTGQPLPEGCVLDGHGVPTRDPERFSGDPPGAILPFGGHKGSGLSFLCEVLAGSLTGGLSSHPDNPTAGWLVNNMLSILVKPDCFSSADAYAEDVNRLVRWVTGSPPVEPGGTVLLPGDVERQTKTERLDRGIPIDANTLMQVRAAAAAVDVPRAMVDGLVE